MTFNECKKKIAALTQEILEKILQDQIDGIDSSIDQRNNYLTELISMASPVTSQTELPEFLKEILQKDQIIMEKVTEQRDLIKKSLLSFSNVKEYISV